MEKATKKNYKKLASRRKMLLYIEAIIYIALLLFCIYLNAFGGIFVKMLPLLFMIGIIGKMLFDRPIITTLLGMLFNIFCLSNYANCDIMVIVQNTIYVGISILSGEIIGEFLCMIKEHKKSIRKVSKRAIYVIPIMTLLITVFSLMMHIHVNGNIIEYMKADAKVKEYISNRYKVTAQTVKREYYIGDDREYIFTKKINDKTYNFSVRENGYIEDEYMQVVLDKYNLATHKNINQLLKAETLKVKNENISITPKYLYKEEKESPDLSLLIKYTNTQETKEVLEEEYVNKVYEIINLLKKDFIIDNLDKIVLEFKSEDQSKIVSYSKELIYSENFTKEYIKNSFIEEIISSD